jgi:hypothetical protein
MGSLKHCPLAAVNICIDLLDIIFVGIVTEDGDSDDVKDLTP